MTDHAMSEGHAPRVSAALLEALAAATWPDGSPLIDLAPEVVEDRLLPALLAAVDALRLAGARDEQVGRDEPTQRDLIEGQLRGAALTHPRAQLRT